MKNFKKVLSLTLALAMIISTMTFTYAATTNDAKAKILYNLGLFLGTSTTVYRPDLEKTADAAQAIVLIGRSLEWEVDQEAVVTFKDVPDYAVPYVEYAIEKGITVGVSDTEFGVDIISGQRVVAWFLRALGYDKAESWTKTATLAATAKIGIPSAILRDDIVGIIFDALQTTPIGGDATLIEMIVAGDTLKTTIAVNAGLMTDVVSILSAKAIGVKLVEVKLNKAVNTADTKIQIKKGSVIYSSKTEWNSAKTTATLTTGVRLPDAEYTAYVTTGGKTITKNFTVLDETATSVEITSAYLDDESSEAQVDFVVKNQYGEDMGIDADTAAADKFSVVAYNVTQKASVSVDVNTDDTFFGVDTASDPDEFEEDDIVRFTVSYKGITSQKNLTVKAAGSYSNIVFGDIVLIDSTDTSLDATDDYVKLTYSLVESNGDVIDFDATSAYATLPVQIQGVQFISSDNGVISSIRIINDSKGKGEIYLKVAGEGTAIITGIVLTTGDNDAVSIKVNGAQSPASVSIDAPNDVVAGGDDAFDLDLTIKDQYGSTLDDVAGITFEYSFDVADDDVTLTPTDTDGDTVLTVDLSNATVKESEGSTKLTISAYDNDDDKIGSISFYVEPNAIASDIDSVSFINIFEFDGSNGGEVTVEDEDVDVVDQYGREFVGNISLTSDDENVVSVSGTTLTAEGVGTATIEVDVDGITYDVDVKVIASADIVSYSMSKIGTVYAASPADTDYQVAVTIAGLDKYGKEVALVDDEPDLVTSSNESIAGVSGNVIIGKTAGTVTISAWMGAKSVDSESVKVSEADPYAVSVEFDKTSIVNGGDLASLVLVIDQYGVEINPNLYFSEKSSSYSISSTDKISGPDGTVTVTVITSNGLTAVATITVY